MKKVYGIIALVVVVGSFVLMSFLNKNDKSLTLPVITLSFPLKSDMYLFSTASDGQGANLNGETVIGDQSVRYYTWAASSTATDDGENILRPTAIGAGSPGRWLKWDRTQKQADCNQATSTALDYIKNKPSISGVSGSYGIVTTSNGIVTSGKRTEAYSGTTNASGNYTVTFGSAYSAAPNIQANIINGTNTNLIKISSISTTGFTVNVVTRVDVVGLLPTYNNVNGASVDVLITEK